MRKRSSVVSVFIVFLFTAITLYALFQTTLGQRLLGFVELTVHPLQRGTYTFYGVLKGGRDKQIQQLLDENRRLTSEIVKYKEQEREITALRDQFAVTEPSSSLLLPAHVIGLKAYVPGFALPEQIVIDKGKRNGIREGSAILTKTSLLGRVSVVQEYTSLVDLVTKRGFSLTAKTAKTNALGVATGKGDGRILLDNVVTSEKLEKGDLVVSKGSIREDGAGIPPGLVIGKIISFEKKPSALFQTAEVVPLIDTTRLDVVFVIKVSQ